MPPYPQPSGHKHQEKYQGGQQQQQGYQGEQQQYSGGSQGYQAGQQQYGGPQQQQGDNEVEKIAVKILPRIINKLGCCVVM